jgi:hypothetical protein
MDGEITVAQLRHRISEAANVSAYLASLGLQYFRIGHMPETTTSLRLDHCTLKPCLLSTIYPLSILSKTYGETRLFIVVLSSAFIQTGFEWQGDETLITDFY